jgi:hypothetical protein
MGEYRHNETGEVKTQGQWRRHFKNISFPRVWSTATLETLKLDPVSDLPPPKVGTYKVAVRNGAVKGVGGEWVTAWVAQDMFSDTETTTKGEQEVAYQATLDATAADNVRNKRALLFSEVDLFGLSDVIMSDSMKTYRQALRDITDHPSFPYLADDDWPE